MTRAHSDYPTPAVLVARECLEANLQGMQTHCDTHGRELWPHIKTHKMVEVARRQLALGAAGLTCAKLSEAEALLPAKPRRIFLAHSLVDPGIAPRLARLAAQVDEVVLAVTSPAHAQALPTVVAATGRSFPVLLAVDTGLGREGARSITSATATAAIIAQQANLHLRGLYTHEGHAYGTAPADQGALGARIRATLVAARDAIDPNLTLWPGCSVTARVLAAHPATHAVRPGAYVFGDLNLSDVTGVMAFTDSALTILTTVVDRPEPGLALIDAGSKVFGQDRTAAGHHARAADGRDLFVTRCNEEHGYLTGQDVDRLAIGDRVEFVPAHVCPVVNLTNTVLVVEAGQVVARWTVDARGCVI